MAQLVSTNISIAGDPITQFSSFQLTQGIFSHHVFRLVCPAVSIDGSTGNIFHQSKNLMGATLTAQINSVGMDGQLRFSGVVTQVETSRFSSYTGDIIITGHSPTIILDNGPHCKSWEKKAVKNIAQDVLKHFPQNLLNPKIAPLYPETLAYYVQYKETAWQFLSRLCATYGEWLYYDGRSLVIGPPAGGNNTALTFGSTLSRFTMALQVRPAALQMMAYDYMNHQVYTSTPSGIEGRAGLNDLGKIALQASQTVYAAQPKVWNNHFLTNKKQLDDVVNIQSAMQSSNHVRFNGASGHPGVNVGGQVSIQGKNFFSQGDETYGDYTVVSVNHFADGQGNYNNDFVAVPSSIKVPPVATPMAPPCEAQSAVVTDNHDPKGLGRVRVKFYWMNGSEKTPWIRVTSPHGGGGKGMFFIPEVGEEIIAGFEGDSAVKPYVIGTVYHGAASNAFSNGGNDVKALQTRSGNKVIMNDAAGSVFVEDKDGNSMMMDGAGNITFKSNKTVTINATDEIIFQTKKITMLAENEVYLESKKLDGQLSETATLFGKNNVTVQSETMISLESQNKVEASANTEVTLNGNSKVTLNSTMVEANGKDVTNIRGGMVNLNT
ncbi:phage baseplate assembly protein V [Flavitalea sp. BT771]|uniref:type VI secretion system Vgr family protein n=1 Tax=Flavitalea sp. BT771 TaxID=3063329 RepID=UPI0026E122B4|nr:phage baseplate assembly protein V [Flavitalea sp. BT771]MDO6429318.1 phage baseplate assembly protein V [Flavitalea sp. BT771]MDV6218554.1 phage baseplate assembly protein V [Flavitalea sp. BT771]